MRIYQHTAARIDDSARTIITRPEDQEITGDIIREVIQEHRARVPRYKRLRDLYEGRHSILYRPGKDLGKPDNRLVANFAKYIVDTYTGYFIGIPVRVSHEKPAVNDTVQAFREWADMEDNENELAKITAIYGHAYEYLYQGSDARTRVAYNSPMDIFIVYADDVQQEPLYSVRYSTNEDGRTVGEIRDRERTREFRETEHGNITIDAGEPHYYGDVPVIEYIENEERLGAFESVITLIDALNNALSSKANDLDYFSDAYLAITGAEITDEVAQGLKDNRLLNIWNDHGAEVSAFFLQKPSDDAMQENHINRLIDLIYQLSMVANVTDESFGNASGVALEFKLQPMRNLARNKERKFVSAMGRRYKMIFNLPLNIAPAYRDDWRALQYNFSQNSPRNLKDEVETAKLMTGLTSDETALSVISAIPNAQQELALRDEETARIPLYPEDFAPAPPQPGDDMPQPVNPED